jgi:hypothetical protein
VRLRTLLLPLLTVALLAAAACSPGTDDTAAERDPDISAATELDDDVAARVGGSDIPAEAVEARFDAVKSGPAAAELDQDGGGDAELRAFVLSQLIVVEVIDAAAGERGITVDDDDVAALRGELAERAGGAAELEAALEASGFTPDMLDDELRATVILDRVGEELVGEGDDEPVQPGLSPDATAPGAGPAGEEVAAARVEAAERWLAEQLAVASPLVHPRYGTWDPDHAQVSPPG